MEYIDIIKGCKKGKPSSQRELVKRFAGLFKAICKRYLPDNQSADDAVQESFINVFRYIKDFREEGSFEGWMKRIAVNTSLNYRKKHFKNSKIHIELVHDDHEKQQVPDAYKNIREEELLSIIKKLPDQYLLVFNMYIIEGFSHSEIGEMLEITASTSRATLSRARAKLIEMLKSEERYTDSIIKVNSYGL